MTRRYLYSLLICYALVLGACNTEADIMPDADASVIKLIPGDRDEFPLSLTLLSNGDYLIVSNSSALVDGATVSKIRVVRMSKRGEIAFDKFYPENNSLSWAAKTVHLIDNEIIIGGNSTINNMLFLKLDEAGDSLQFNTSYPNNPYYLDSKVEDNAILLLTTDRSKKIDIEYFSANSLLMEGGVSKSFNVDTVPAASLFIKGDTVAFATKQTVNYSLWPSDRDLDDDAKLKTLNNAGNYKINYLLNTPPKKTALAFGVVSVGTNSKWFSMLSDVKENLGNPSAVIFEESIPFNDIMHNVHVEDDHILICGARSAEGEDNSNFLLMKTDLSGRLQFSRSFGSSASENELYDAIWDNGRIVTVGTTAFGGKKTIIITTLSETGRIIR